MTLLVAGAAGIGVDTLDIGDLLEGDVVLASASVAQSGADTVISMTGGGRMVLVGVRMSALTEGRIFGA